MREETSELPARTRVGGGEVQRPRSPTRLLLVVAGVVVFGVVAYALFTIVASGAPSRADYVASVNDVCRGGMPRIRGLNGESAPNARQAASSISDMSVQIEELERPAAGKREINRFMSTLERVASGLEELDVSQRANNNRSAQEAARKLQRSVARFENASKNLGTERCTFER